MTRLADREWTERCILSLTPARYSQNFVLHPSQDICLWVEGESEDAPWKLRASRPLALDKELVVHRFVLVPPDNLMVVWHGNTPQSEWLAWYTLKCSEKSMQLKATDSTREHFGVEPVGIIGDDTAQQLIYVVYESAELECRIYKAGEPISQWLGLTKPCIVAHKHILHASLDEKSQALREWSVYCGKNKWGSFNASVIKELCYGGGAVYMVMQPADINGKQQLWLLRSVGKNLCAEHDGIWDVFSISDNDLVADGYPVYCAQDTGERCVMDGTTRISAVQPRTPQKVHGHLFFIDRQKGQETFFLDGEQTRRYDLIFSPSYDEERGTIRFGARDRNNILVVTRDVL